MQVSKIALPFAFDVRAFCETTGMYWKQMIEVEKRRMGREK